VVLELVEELGSVLAGRPAAARMRERVITAASTGEVIVDLDRIEAISPSFADEFFAKLPSGLLEEKRVRFEHVTPELDKIVRTVISVRIHLDAS
jgi:hypothetical protein